MLVIVILLINVINIVSEAAHKIPVAKTGFSEMPCRDVSWPLGVINENGKLAIFLFPLLLFLCLLYIDTSTFQSSDCPGPLLQICLVLRDLGSSLFGTTVFREQGLQGIS